MIIEVFLPLVVGALKPSITFRSLSLLQLTPSLLPSSLPSSLQLAPQFAPARSSSLPAHSPVRSSLLPSLLQLAPACSPVCSSLLLSCPIAPYTPQVVGTPTHTWPLGASWSELGVSWEQAGARGVSWSKLEQAGSELE